MKKRSNLNVMMRLIRLVKPLTGFMILAILMGLIGHLCASFITVFGGYAVLSVLGEPVFAGLGTLFVCVLIFAFVRGFLRYAEQACNHFIAFKLLALIRDHVFLALRRLCPAKLEGKDKGNLINLITSDIELLEVFYAHTISPVMIAVLYSAVMIPFIGRYHWALGLLAAAAYAVVGIVVPLTASKRSGDSGMQFRGRSGELGTFVLDSLRGLDEILQYGAGEKRLEEMNRRTDDLAGVEEKLKKSTGWNLACTNAIIYLFDVAMLAAASILYVRGEVQFEGLLIPVLALFSSFGPVVALAALGSTLSSTFAAGNRVLDLLDEEPVTEEVKGKEAVEFDGAAASHVTFSYDNEEILSDVTLDVKKHQIIGIVGKSGSGKSTLLKLFMRFWKAGNGRILISDRPVDDINTTNLRDMESFVTQDTHLFHDSIFNNLRIAKLSATMEEVEAACRKASVHDFIMSLPQGYDTPVGELGDTLSGGERQRLGLARAFLHDAPFLLLDEPTSNLDSLNEAVILSSLRREREGKTVVLVSHRQSTMRVADAVYSVEHGRMS